MVTAPVLQDHLVNDLPTEDAFPPEKMFAITIKLFIDHHSTTAITPHIDLLHLEKQLVSEILPSAKPWGGVLSGKDICLGYHYYLWGAGNRTGGGLPTWLSTPAIVEMGNRDCQRHKNCPKK
jgi:hypothetical protein